MNAKIGNKELLDRDERYVVLVSILSADVQCCSVIALPDTLLISRRIWRQHPFSVTLVLSLYICTQAMIKEGNHTHEQTGFFSDTGELGGRHHQFTEICTALYERELMGLAHTGSSNNTILKRRLSGLPHHVRSVARYLVANPTPLSIDTHNGSWYYKQAGKCPGIMDNEEKTLAWFLKHADYGVVVPIFVKSLEGMHIELDSIDKVDANNHQIHVNRHGWFLYSGAQYDENMGEHGDKKLFKPTKAVMAAACCGHAWNYKSKTSPRSLSLREMRLSTQINWTTFT